jgi:hypothetical protein
MIRKTVKLIRKIIGTGEIIDAQLFRGVIEDCEWIKHKSFAPGGWAMDNAALYTLFRILNDVRPKNVLEFGLGQSSKMVHQYATFIEDTKALTIEHDDEWINFCCKSIQKDINMNIQHIDEEIVVYNGVETLSYKNIDEITNVGGYDLIIVDGPFGSPRYSRSQIINIVSGNLPKQFCILMDDSNRKGEKETIKAICKIFEDKKTNYFIKEYASGKKSHTVICSDDLKFLKTLR